MLVSPLWFGVAERSSSNFLASTVQVVSEGVPANSCYEIALLSMSPVQGISSPVFAYVGGDAKYGP